MHIINTPYTFVVRVSCYSVVFLSQEVDDGDDDAST